MSEWCYRPGASIPEQAHPSPTLCVVLAGGYEKRYRRQRIDCPAGTVVYHAAGDRHANRFGGLGGRCLEFVLADEPGGEDPAGRTALRGQIGPALVAPRWTLFKIWREAQGADDLSPQVLEEQLVRLLDELRGVPALRLDGDPPRWLRHVRERLQDEFVDPPTLRELSADAGVHRTHLARAFRTHYHCTVGEYVRLRRISVASAALRGTSEPLSRIALDSGFADQSHMTRTFRDLVGLTPGRFRALAS